MFFSFIGKGVFNRTSNLKILNLEEMPELKEIANEAFKGLKNLTKLTLDGSRSLTAFPPQAFDRAANLLDVIEILGFEIILLQSTFKVILKFILDRKKNNIHGLLF